MAICTQCGLLMHEQDVDTHVCNPLDIPEAMKPRKNLYTVEFQNGTI